MENYVPFGVSFNECMRKAQNSLKNRKYVSKKDINLINRRVINSDQNENNIANDQTNGDQD